MTSNLKRKNVHEFFKHRDDSMCETMNCAEE